MRGITSPFRGLNLVSKLLSESNHTCAQIHPLRSVKNLHIVFSQFAPYSVSCCKRTNVTELRDGFGNANWTATLTESRKILKMDSQVSEMRTRSTLSVPMEGILRRLQVSRNANTYLINTFKHLLNTNHDSAIQWPGLVILLLTKAIYNPFASDNFVSKALEDVTWKSQIELAEIINLLHSSLIFNGEYHRCTVSQSRNSITPRNDISQLVSNYFHSSVLYRIGEMGNYKVAWMIASILESLAEARSTKNTISVQSQLIRTLDDWEHRTFHPRGLLLANGCQASLELGGHGQKTQQVGHEFGKYLALAIKAHTDIQQFVRYHKSISSCFDLGCLPIVLHLENNPETLAYIYSCEDTLDNLDYFVLHSAVISSAGLHEAKELMYCYIQKTTDILESFDQTPAILNLIRLTESLKYIELCDFSPKLS